MVKVESEEKSDILLLDVRENYHNITHKVRTDSFIDERW